MKKSVVLGLMVLLTLNVGIGIANPQNKLNLNGTIHAKELKVSLDCRPDSVFNEGYELLSLKTDENYIKTNKHLQDIPSAKEVSYEGTNLGKMDVILLKKIEELILYKISLDKAYDLLSREIELLKSEINT